MCVWGGRRWGSFVTRDNQELVSHEALDFLDKCLRYGEARPIFLTTPNLG